MRLWFMMAFAWGMLLMLVNYSSAAAQGKAGQEAAKSFFNWASLTHFDSDGARLIAQAMVILFLVYVIWQGRLVWRRWMDYRTAKKPTPTEAAPAGAAPERLVETASRKEAFPERRKNTDNLEFMLRLLREILGDGNGTKGRLEKMIEALQEDVKALREEQKIMQRQMCLGHRVHMVLLTAINEIRKKMGFSQVDMPAGFDEQCEKCGLKTNTEKEK